VSEAEAQVTLSEFFATPRACEPIRIGEAAFEAGACEAEAEAAPAADEADDAAAAERADETHGTGMRFYWNSGRTRHVHSNLHVMKDGTLPHFLPDRRERLLDALAQFGQPEAADIDCRLWGSVVIDGTKCSSCRMCATFCPTGAIAKFDGADGTMGVMHYPADCVKCASCQDICPEDAIILMGSTKTHFLADGTCHKYNMTPREISLRNNPHQMLETMRKNIPGDNVFER
jgi:ferredoxin